MGKVHETALGIMKPSVARASLQVTPTDPIINSGNKFHWCPPNVAGIEFFYVDSPEMSWT